MNITPIETRIASGTPLRTMPVARRPIRDPDVDQTQKPSTPPPPPVDGKGSSKRPGPTTPEMSLSRLIAQLSRQLRAIEQTFMRALQSLARQVDSTGSPGAASNGQAPSRARSGVSPYDGLIRRTAQKYELDPSLLSAVIRQESGFDPAARSSAGAMGLMQLMPDTAKSLGVTDPYDPAQNVDGGARMLRGLIDRYGGRLDLALAAYNAGPEAVAKYGGIPPYAETREYVHAILGAYRVGALGVRTPSTSG